MPIYFRQPSKRKVQQMNRRQRKKFHLGEFQALIFGVQGSLGEDYQDSTDFDHFMDELIDFIEVNHIQMAGGGDSSDFTCLFQPDIQRSFTPEQRQFIINWLTARTDVATLHATPLVDGFYAPDESWEDYSETYK